MNDYNSISELTKLLAFRFHTRSLTSLMPDRIRMHNKINEYIGSEIPINEKKIHLVPLDSKFHHKRGVCFSSSSTAIG